MAVVVKDWSWQELADLAREQYESYSGDDIYEKTILRNRYFSLQWEADKEK